MTGILFLAALFFNPVFAIIPACATAPALVFVGYLMLKNVRGIDFEDPTEGIPAFITIMTMPFAYSISKGIMWGMITYVFVKLVSKKYKEIPVVTMILAAIFVGDIIFEGVKESDSKKNAPTAVEATAENVEAPAADVEIVAE